MSFRRSPSFAVSVQTLRPSCRCRAPARGVSSLKPSMDWDDILPAPEINKKEDKAQQKKKQNSTESLLSYISALSKNLEKAKGPAGKPADKQPARPLVRPNYMQSKMRLSLSGMRAEREATRKSDIDKIEVSKGAKWKLRKADGSARAPLRKNGKQDAGPDQMPSAQEVLKRLSKNHQTIDLVGPDGVLQPGMRPVNVLGVVPDGYTLAVLNESIESNSGATVLVRVVKFKGTAKGGNGQDQVRQQIKRRSSQEKAFSLSWHISDNDLHGHKSEAWVSAFTKHARVVLNIGKPGERLISMDRKAEVVRFVDELCQKYGTGTPGRIPEGRGMMTLKYDSSSEKIFKQTGILSLAENENEAKLANLHAE